MRSESEWLAVCNEQPSHPGRYGLKEHPHRALTVITALWVIGTPLVRMQMLTAQSGYAFLAFARYFQPEILVAAIFLMLLPSIWMRRRWTPHLLVALAVLLLVLLASAGFTDLWFISFLLLLVLAYVVRSVPPGSVAARAHPVMWLCLLLSRGLMYLGTPGAYLQLCAGAIGALEGFRRGHRALATALLICSALGLYGLWTVWSISTRVRTHGKYVVHTESGRVKDARGLLAAWIAVIGLAAISTSIFRGEEVFILSVLLVPSLLTTTVVASMGFPEKVEGPATLSLTGLPRRTSARQYVGVACGIAVGLLAILPVTRAGYGICPLIDMFPLGWNVWPTQGLTVYGLHQGCNAAMFGQTVLLAVASFVFWTSGLLAVVSGRSRDPWHGAIASAVAALIVLTWTVTARVAIVLALPLNPLPPVSYYINWVATVSIGIALVLWAARLGYLGGRRAVRGTKPQTAPDGGIQSEAI